MALKIRLRPQGRKNRQTYRLVVTDQRNPIDGKYLEMLGWYDPYQEENNTEIKAERVRYWLNLGAVISERARALVRRTAPDLIKQETAKRVLKNQKRAIKRRALKT